MGEHQTWLDLLFHFEWWRNLHERLQGSLGREAATDTFPTEFTLNHVVFGLLVAALVGYGGYRFWQSVNRPGGIVPPRSFGIRNFFELITEIIFNLMLQMMGEKHAKRFLPLVGSLAFFILFSNLLALIPGMGVPTTTLNTNLALALMVFLIYNVVGVREHGLAYFKHFLGPVPLLAPLMLPIELISHIARPMSLSVRLLGNMSADHKVLFIFTSLTIFLVPVPFLLLGLLVSIVQTVVFCLLSTVYISLALSHDH
jgi:F-type H+-transporting ATPase subunit a